MGAFRNLKNSFQEALAIIPYSRWRTRARFLTAADRNDFDTVKALAQKYPEAVKWQDDNGRTALQLACKFNQVETAKYLIERGADINTSNIIGFTPMHSAAGSNADKIIRILHERGALLDARNDDGNTPLMFAAICGKDNSIKTLIACGADCNAVDKDGQTARGIAEMLGYGRTVGTFDAMASVAAGHASARLRREEEAAQKARDADIAIATAGLPHSASVFRKPVSLKLRH